MEISGSTAFVTGANRGIGRALLDALLDRGARRVYAASRTAMTQTDERVVPLQLDITDPAQIAAAAALATDVTLLINNAGSLAFTDSLTGDLAAVESDWRTNYLGTLAMSRAFVPVLQANAPGAIVNLLTLLAFAPVPAIGGYSASKAAAASATQALRAQLTGTGITVHGVFPGAVDTDMSSAFPIPKATPAEVAAAILDGLEAKQDNIFPDPMSRNGYDLWRSDPAALEHQMASI
ncbi:short-chain dehydrogenase [Rhizocola hellebori]|uniref:Short-chain dehydrogenase n=1 Tax=Rhizocola hellebori TaxID=1392758 RepID=A0A8J3VJU8_9ACTN|nr:SDR family oxidoreductase [Rhizocola hellebori]GIH08862.1 short-chain dehydrogenase [Rhizocola hellebori]